jgi:hypothetical protein
MKLPEFIIAGMRACGAYENIDWEEAYQAYLMQSYLK